MVSVSLIIPALNEAENIVKAIDAGWSNQADEIIVVDGGSDDRTRELVDESHATLVSSRTGRAIQQNAGAKRATSDFLLFQHADCWLEHGAIAQLRDACSHGAVHFGCFRQQIANPRWPYRCLEFGNAIRAGWLGMAYGDQGIFVRRRVFEEIGGFDGVPLMEDVLLLRKLRTYGRPQLLKGPICVSDRRWRTNGVVKQTALNWTLMTAFRLGVSPERLSRFYPNHATSKG